MPNLNDFHAFRSTSNSDFGDGLSSLKINRQILLLLSPF
jgi:hypothetical protein